MDLLVVLMSEYRPCAHASFENIDELGSLGKVNLSVGTEAYRNYKKSYFESRKRRPYERGKKKRKKGKREPLSFLCKSTGVRN